MERNLILGSLAVAIFFGVLLSFDSNGNEVPTISAAYKHSAVTIAGKTFDALVSDTDALREQGLSGRSELKAGQAMIFIFDKPDNLGFWMKDMRFSIDMLWLDSQHRGDAFL